MKIIVDTREQKPYVFENQIIKKLEIGDYSVEGHEDCFCIERKSKADE